MKPVLMATSQVQHSSKGTQTDNEFNHRIRRAQMGQCTLHELHTYIRTHYIVRTYTKYNILADAGLNTAVRSVSVTVGVSVHHSVK